MLAAWVQVGPDGFAVSNGADPCQLASSDVFLPLKYPLPDIRQADLGFESGIDLAQSLTACQNAQQDLNELVGRLEIPLFHRNLDTFERLERQILLVMCRKRRQWRVLSVYQLVCKAKFNGHQNPPCEAKSKALF
jgi:hypothetical protein